MTQIIVKTLTKLGTILQTVQGWAVAAVNALTTIEEEDAYDYTTGYPQRLSFSV